MEGKQDTAKKTDLEQEGSEFASGLTINHLLEPEFEVLVSHLSNCNNALDWEDCGENHNTW